MRKLYSLVAALAMIMILTGCNETVPAGNVGKVLGPTGWQKEVYPPSIVNIDNGPFTQTSKKEHMYLMETTTQKFVQNVKVKLADNMELRAAIIFTGRINASSEPVINALFNDMKMNPGDRTIETAEVYDKYGKQIVLQTARAVISPYKVQDINLNYNRINQELKKRITEQLKGLPMSITNVTMGEIQYPKIVIDAIDKAQERKMQIEEEKAQVQIELTRIKGKEQVAIGETKIKLLEGKRIRDYNKLIQAGITPDLLKLRKLELQEKALDVRLVEANKWDGKVPTTYMGNQGHIPIIMDMKK